MATQQELIRDALTLAGVIGKTQAPSAQQAQDALTALNEMMAEWDEAVLRKLGWYKQTDLTATFPVPDWALRGVKGSLSRVISADYQLPVTPEVTSMQTAGMTAIRKKTVTRREASMSHLSQGQAIISDSDPRWE